MRTKFGELWPTNGEKFDRRFELSTDLTRSIIYMFLSIYY